MSDKISLADRLNAIAEHLQAHQTRPEVQSSVDDEIVELHEARRRDLEELSALRQEVRDLIEEIKND